MKIEKYFEDLAVGVTREYAVAEEARRLGLDSVDVVECSLAMTLAEKSVGLVLTVCPKLPAKKISDRILELEGEYGQLDTTVSFVIAREIAEGKFCEFENQLEAIDAGIRVGFAYMTLGVVASPIEGYTGLRVQKLDNRNQKLDKGYFVASFSGPIRSAGTTSVCVFLMLIDYLREYFGYAKYDPTEDEVSRYITENVDFHERVSNLQYFPTEEEMRFLAERLPFQIDGEPTSRREVSNYRDLSRVGTNFIRGGMCLAFSEGLAQKAGKAIGRLRSCKENGLKCTGFDWLEDYLVLHKKREGGVGDVDATYIKDLVAGRPVYGHPSRSGGFRFRYGRGRTAGFSAVSVHPATMGVTNGFLSNGTQLKIERPTKGCIVTSCDSIDGPIVKLRSGAIRRVKSYEEGVELYSKIEEIIYLGDILFPIGDVIDRNAQLIVPGYTEEQWGAQRFALGGLKTKSSDGLTFRVGGLASGVPQKVKGSSTRLSSCGNEIGFDEVVEISRRSGVPLHPGFIFYWSQISGEEFIGLIRWLNGSVWRDGKLVLPWAESERERFGVGKRALELLGVEHEVVLDNVVVDGDARAFLFNLGKSDVYNGEVLEFRAHENDERSVLEIVNEMCEVEIRDKAGSFIGARMGRPEKAKLRKLVGSPNGLFPVGEQGGRLKSVQDAVGVGFVESEFPAYKCGCALRGSGRGMQGESRFGIYSKCEVCGERAYRDLEGLSFSKRKVDVKSYFEDAVEKLGYGAHEVPPMVKGVGRMVSEGREVENLAKGILRAKFGLSVNKDGTVRYDGTEIPLTHFKPREIRTSVERLRELGYEKDVEGKDLVDENQILELFPHDVVLSSCSKGKDERADDVFFNIANFVDEELERFYKLPRFYNLERKENLVGQLVVCMAPHNCAGVVGRIIGFSEMQGLLASPYMHAAMRRDCDGDEAAVMMLMDVLLNFSQKFLPSHRGGRQDAPLVLNARIRAGEVDDQILFFEICSRYPLSLYEMAESAVSSSQLAVGSVELVKDRLKVGGDEPFVGAGFTHDTSDINFGNNNGAYKSLPTMKEKVAAQMELVGKIRAVDEDDVARLVLERHFIRDIRGNLRKFGRQGFRCAKCNEKFRRPPLAGVCNKCKGKIIFTISEGSIKKYLEPALELMGKYDISDYTKEGMELTREYIEGIFGGGEEQREL